MTDAEKELLGYFTYDHLPIHLRSVSKRFAVLAWELAADVPAGPQRQLGLQLLLLAKDAFVRAALPTQEDPVADAEALP
jgi:hypothetical protein